MYKILKKTRFVEEVNPKNVGTTTGTMHTAVEKCAKMYRWLQEIVRNCMGGG